MRKLTWRIVTGMTLVALVTLASTPLSARCGCRNRSYQANTYGAGIYDEAVAAPLGPLPEAEGLFGHGSYGQPQIPLPAPAPEERLSPLPEANPGPPPGTIGTTYRRPTREISESKHPRSAIIEIRGLSGDVKAVAKGMRGYRSRDGIYRLETKEALTPGAPHIIEVYFENRKSTERVSFSRYVRLIPGRVIGFDF